MTSRTDTLDRIREMLDSASRRCADGRDGDALERLIDAVAMLTDLIEKVAGPEK